MNHRLKFSRNQNGSLDLSEHALEPIVAALRETAGPQLCLPDEVMRAVEREFVKLCRERAADDPQRFEAAAKNLATECPNLFWLTRGVSPVPGCQPDGDVS